MRKLKLNADVEQPSHN